MTIFCNPKHFFNWYWHLCVCVHFLFWNVYTHTRTLGMLYTVYAIKTIGVWCVSVITFGIAGIWKNKFLCWRYFYLILCQHINRKVCIYSYLSSTSPCSCNSLNVHHNLRKIPYQVWSFIYSHFTWNSPMTKTKNEGEAWVKVIMVSRFSGLYNEIY